MGSWGELSLGRLVRERHPGQSLLIGFSTYAGTVTAASDWGGAAERKRVRPGLAGSWEACFHELGVDFAITADGQAPRERRLQRAIGVIYRPESERQSHYFEAEPARAVRSADPSRYDWAARAARARKSLGAGRGAGDLPVGAVSAVATAVRVPVGAASLDGDLAVPDGATGVVLFAHGSGSSRHSPRNRYVAERAAAGAGWRRCCSTCSRPSEEAVDQQTGAAALRHRPARRAPASQPPTGCGRAAGDARAADRLLRRQHRRRRRRWSAAARPGSAVGAVVSRGGRPDLAGDALRAGRGADAADRRRPRHHGHGAERACAKRLRAAAKKLEIVPGATHLFEEPGALEQVARLACGWFLDHLAAA